MAGSRARRPSNGRDQGPRPARASREGIRRASRNGRFSSPTPRWRPERLSRRGVALKRDGRVKSALDAWLRIDLLERFSGRIVDITAPVADLWGELMANSKRRGIALHAMDGFLAATARLHKQTLVTRNIKDFAVFGLPLVNPWGGE